MAKEQKYEDIHFVDSTRPVWNYSLFTEEDIENFQQGTHYRLYELFGARGITVLDKKDITLPYGLPMLPGFP
ncbi:hypothetical protein [Paraflavitalea speifideaquila]|uniref:hypothetical protein n=1 Tax=Paraflavitalea speifideaquila TaxID=3076558 RepID=UPI0028E69BCB|nr:hypothetical protein [Paraflavitalea speifideiaquila]